MFVYYPLKLGNVSRYSWKENKNVYSVTSVDINSEIALYVNCSRIFHLMFVFTSIQKLPGVYSNKAVDTYTGIIGGNGWNIVKYKLYFSSIATPNCTNSNKRRSLTLLSANLLVRKILGLWIIKVHHICLAIIYGNSYSKVQLMAGICPYIYTFCHTQIHKHNSETTTSKLPFVQQKTTIHEAYSNHGLSNAWRMSFDFFLLHLPLCK